MEHDHKKKKDEARRRGTSAAPKTGSRKPSTGNKAQWRSSKAINHRFGEEDLESRSTMKGLRESQKSMDDPTRMHESYRMENSFGTISMGFNKEKKGAVVLSSKRGTKGSARETEKNLNMGSSRKDYNHRGEFHTNLSENMGGAWAYMGETTLPDLKILKKAEEFQERYDSDLVDERMPFLQLKEKKEEMADLHEQAKEAGLAGDVYSQKLAERKSETLWLETEKLENEEKRVRKNLQFGWQKSKLAAESKADIRDEREKEIITGGDMISKIITAVTGTGSSDSQADNGMRKPLPEEDETEDIADEDDIGNNNG